VPVLWDRMWNTAVLAVPEVDIRYRKSQLDTHWYINKISF